MLDVVFVWYVITADEAELLYTLSAGSDYHVEPDRENVNHQHRESPAMKVQCE